VDLKLKAYSRLAGHAETWGRSPRLLGCGLRRRDGSSGRKTGYCPICRPLDQVTWRASVGDAGSNLAGWEEWEQFLPWVVRTKPCAGVSGHWSREVANAGLPMSKFPVVSNVDSYHTRLIAGEHPKPIDVVLRGVRGNKQSQWFGVCIRDRAD
jgi:hypothetical protein